MTCRDVDHLLILRASGGAIPPDAAAHIAGCARCTRRVRALGASGAVAPPARDFADAILSDLEPVRPVASASARFAALVCVVAVVAAAGVALLGTAGWHALGALQRTAVFTALAAAAALTALSLSRQVVPGSRVNVCPPLLAAAGPALMAAIFAALFRPQPEPAFVRTGLFCLRTGLECAAAAALLFWLVLRRGVVLRPAAAGAVAGALAGLAGLTVLEIFCPNLNQHHVIVWHLGAAVTSTLAGVAIGSIVERTCASRR